MLALGGGSCSGKTTARKLVAEHFREAGIETLDIRFDNYYRDQGHLSVAERENVNYDNPATVDLAWLRRNLQLLRQGEIVEAPLYTMKTHTRDRSRTSLCYPKHVIIVDGIFAFKADEKQDGIEDDDGAPLFDMKIYFEADKEKCLERRIKRDIEERGRTKAQARRQWNETVYPGFLTYLQPERDRAHMVLTWNHPIEENEKYAKLLFDYLLKKYHVFRAENP